VWVDPNPDVDNGRFFYGLEVTKTAG
jgi:hypothetical protein